MRIPSASAVPVARSPNCTARRDLARSRHPSGQFGERRNLVQARQNKSSNVRM
jgi:hypothetical protein